MIIGKQAVNYNVQKGTVLQIDTHLETVVSGEGGGGTSYNGNGATRGITISSRTINHQKVFMKAADGSEFWAQLQDWNITAMRGHELVLIWAETPQQRNYALIYNKTLDAVYYSNLKAYFRTTDDNTGCAMLIIAVIATIVFPATAASQLKNDMIGWILFVIMLIGCIFIYRKWQRDIGDSIDMSKLFQDQLHNVLRQFI